MDLHLNERERQFQSDVRSWLQDHLPIDIADKVRLAQRLSKADHQRWARALGRRGWLAHAWPEHYGGHQWTPMQRHLFEDECARAYAPPVQTFGPAVVGPLIIAHGDPGLQSAHLPGIASGEHGWCQGFAEPGAGSDLAAIQCTAEPDGEHYLVNGRKTWVHLAQHADWMLGLVRTEQEGAPEDGLTLLAIDMNAPGVSVLPISLMDGENDMSEVVLDAVRVPMAKRIGEAGRGWHYTQFLRAIERTSSAQVAQCKRELARLQRVAHLEGVWDDMRLRDRIAAIEVDVVALEMLVLRTLSAEAQLDAGHAASPGHLAMMVKIRGNEVEQQLAELMRVLGGPAALPWQPEALDAEWQGEAVGGPHCAPLNTAYFRSRQLTMGSDSAERQRQILAESLLNP